MPNRIYVAKRRYLRRVSPCFFFYVAYKKSVFLWVDFCAHKDELLEHIQTSHTSYSTAAYVVLHCTGGFCYTPIPNGKGVRMMLSTEYKERIERQFCAFCKTVLHHASCNYFKTKNRQRQREISSDYLYEQWGFEPCSTDKYFVKEDNPTAFMMIGQTVMVDNEALANALLRLSERRREIILLSYYLRYTEVQIAALLKLSLIHISC